MNDGMNERGPGNDEYETPPWLFKALDSEFGFNLDAAASDTNYLCRPYITCLKDNKLPFPWSTRAFCNPPYSNIEEFVGRALSESCMWVLLLPVRTDTGWFTMLRESDRTIFRYFRKRIRFYLNGKPTDSPRFASMVVIVRPK